MATIKSTGIWKLQLSSLQGPEGCNSQVPSCLKVARSRIPGEVIVAARVVKTQTSIIRIRGSLSFCRFRTFPCVFLWFALGFDDPGCYYQVLGGLTVATRWQLSSPRGPESYNSQSPGTRKLQLSNPRGPESCNSQVPGDMIVAARVVKTQTTIVRICGSLSFCRFRTVPYVF